MPWVAYKNYLFNDFSLILQKLSLLFRICSRDLLFQNQLCDHRTDTDFPGSIFQTSMNRYFSNRSRWLLSLFASIAPSKTGRPLGTWEFKIEPLQKSTIPWDTTIIFIYAHNYGALYKKYGSFSRSNMEAEREKLIKHKFYLSM